MPVVQVITCTRLQLVHNIYIEGYCKLTNAKLRNTQNNVKQFHQMRNNVINTEIHMKSYYDHCLEKL